MTKMKASLIHIIYGICIITCGVLLEGCEQRPGVTAHGVTAYWDAETETLIVSGHAAPERESVKIHDAANGALLGDAIIQEDGSWTASATTPACDVHVELTDGTVTVAVEAAPIDCTANQPLGISSRVLAVNDIPANVLVVDNPVVLNTIPNAVILSPPQDMNISTGDSVNFQGAVIGTGITPPFNFYWNFAGVAPNSIVQNPGVVQFNTPGVYFIQLTVTDSLGISDPTPAVRTITVSDANSPIASTPVPVITSPPSNNGIVSINVGESLFFSGSASDASGVNAFTYEWSFSGIYPNQYGAQPGLIPFNRAGTYQVSLYATNALGLRSAVPAIVNVVVSNTAATNQAPSGSITSPRNNIVINVGETVSFSADGRDPDNNVPLRYTWDFQTAAPNIVLSASDDAGPVTFNTPGVYAVRMTVTDSLGAADPNPPVRIVTVQNTAQPPAPQNGVLAAQIISPPSDLTIRPGESVFFSGQAFSNTGSSGPFQYFWDFNNAATNSTLQTPGNITFQNPGQFFVTFYATDFNGISVGAPTTRIITVSDPTNVSANIVSPVDNATVQVGVPINLIGNVSNINGNGNLRYEWSIRERGQNNDIFNSSQLSPGQFVFTQPGNYRIRLRVSGTDAFGNPIVATSTRSRVTVTAGVVPPGGSTGTPGPIVNTTGILLPATDTFVYVGSTVDFEANDIPGNVQYSWDFAGARTPSNRRNPSPVQFNTPGTFFITLRVTGDSNGVPVNIFDQRTVTVMQQNPAFPPSNPVAQNTGILRPATDVVINAGGRVEFEANRFSGGSVNYQWSFGNAASPSTRRTPAPVQFNTPGTYLVTLQVTGTSNNVPVNIFEQRMITVLQQGTSAPPISNPPPANPIAAGTGILMPATDMVINTGTQIDFEASRISGNNINYVWNFGSMAAPSTKRRPAPVQFNTPGTFLVTLQVTGDVNGLPINVFDQRAITVLQQTSPFTPPTGPVVANGGILSPATDMVINAGNEVNFEATNVPGANLNFQWDFSGVRSPSSRRNPRPVRFDTPGTYFIRLQVTGTYNGVPVNISDQRVITVLQAATPPVTSPIPAPPVQGASSPEGFITQPASQLVSIRAGQSVNFAGSGFDPLGVGPLTFQWSFGGARRNIETQTPGAVTFDRVGVFVVSLLVRNAAGQYDLTPATVLVNVTP